MITKQFLNTFLLDKLTVSKFLIFELITLWDKIKGKQAEPELCQAQFKFKQSWQ